MGKTQYDKLVIGGYEEEVKLVANYINKTEEKIYIDKNPYNYFEIGNIITINDKNNKYRITKIGISSTRNIEGDVNHVYMLRITPYECEGKDHSIGAEVNLLLRGKYY